jgi:hypothetical protein
MSMPLRHYADDHVCSVVAVTTGLRLPALPHGREGGPGTDRAAAVEHPGFPLTPIAPEHEERTP